MSSPKRRIETDVGQSDIGCVRIRERANVGFLAVNIGYEVSHRFMSSVGVLLTKTGCTFHQHSHDGTRVK